MVKILKKAPIEVCIVSSHLMVLDKLRQLLEKSDCRICSNQLVSVLAPDLSAIEGRSAAVYVIDGHAARLFKGALLGNILNKHEDARLLVIGDKLTEANSHAMLRQGVKGILSYEEAPKQLPRALPLVAAGGFWVPRAVLSSFVDAVLSSPSGHRLHMNPPTQLSRREQEVLNLLLENLANKELAERLHIAERTVKFHVSNLLAKFGVRRRADLILLHCQRQAITVRLPTSCVGMGTVPGAHI
jgi:DNA-binding NarL/FixJ family response regulator